MGHRRFLPLLALIPLGIGAVWYGHQPAPSNTGFVAVRTTFALSPSDAYMLGTVTLDPLNKGAPAEATFSEPVGSTKLRLRRSGATFDLCDLAVRRNRITTVTVVAVDNTMRCRIDA